MDGDFASLTGIRLTEIKCLLVTPIFVLLKYLIGSAYFHVFFRAKLGSFSGITNGLRRVVGVILLLRFFDEDSSIIVFRHVYDLYSPCCCWWLIESCSPVLVAHVLIAVVDVLQILWSGSGVWPLSSLCCLRLGSGRWSSPGDVID